MYVCSLIAIFFPSLPSQFYIYTCNWYAVYTQYYPALNNVYMNFRESPARAFYM